MTTMLGGDLEQLTGLAGSFDREAEAVLQLRGRVDAVLGSTLWTGPGAERFRETWATQFGPSLLRLAESLHEHAAAVRSRREAIAAATS